MKCQISHRQRVPGSRFELGFYLNRELLILEGICLYSLRGISFSLRSELKLKKNKKHFSGALT